MGTKRISNRFIYFFGALGGLLFGYDTGVISGQCYLLGTNWGFKRAHLKMAS